MGMRPQLETVAGEGMEDGLRMAINVRWLVNEGLRPEY